MGTWGRAPVSHSPILTGSPELSRFEGRLYEGDPYFIFYTFARAISGGHTGANVRIIDCHAYAHTHTCTLALCRSMVEVQTI